MRLNELKGYKNISFNIDDNWYKIYQYLKSKGLKHLGSGMFGQVWDFGNSRWALKLFREDIAYEDWINFCNSHKNNIHCPKFKGKLITINDVKEIKGILIEKLIKLNQKEYMDFNNLLFGIIDKCKKLKENDNPFGDIEFIDNQEKNETFVKDEDLYEIIKFIAGSGKYRFDIKYDNFMKRNNGQIVITDPLA